MLKKSFLCNKTQSVSNSLYYVVFFILPGVLLHTSFYLSASCAKLAQQQFTLCVPLPCQLSFHLITIFNHCQHLQSTPLYRRNTYPPLLSTVLHTTWLCDFKECSKSFTTFPRIHYSKTVICVLCYTLQPKPTNKNFPLSATV